MPKALEKVRKKISSQLQGKINPRTRKPYTQSEMWAIAKAQSEKTQKKEMLFTSGLQLKEVGDKFYVEGFVSSEDYDGEGDRFLNQESLVWQLNNNAEAKMGSFHHDRAGSALAMLKESKLIDGKAWIKAELNPHNPDYGKAVAEIKSGAVNGFSVEHQPLAWLPNESYNKDTNRGRDILETHVFGYGLASRPVNPVAEITNFYFKEFLEENKEEANDLKTNLEEKNMVEETKNIQNKEEEEATPEEKTEETTEEKEETTPEEPEKTEAEEKEFKEFKAFKELKAKDKENKEFKARVDKILEEKEKGTSGSPVINPGTHIESKELEVKEVADYKASLEAKETTLDMQYKAAANLVNRFPEMALRSGYNTREVKEFMKGIEYKAALTKTTSEASQYYQAVAELNDVYDPLIYNTMNDATTTWNLLPTDNHAGKQMVQFRILSAGFTAAAYAEGDGTWTASTWTLKKQEQDFANYRVTIEITGQMMASAAGGGIGDVFSDSVRRGAVDLAKKLNLDFIAGSTSNNDGSTDMKMLGMKHIANDAGTLYGRDRSSNTYLQGNDSAAGSIDLTLSHLRLMKRTVAKNGADLNNLVFVTSYFQADRIRSIYQNIQRMVPTSSRAGFTGRIELDGIPVFEDQNCDDDYVFLIDLSATRKAIQVGPTMTEFGITGDQRKAFIKIYVTPYCTNPNRTYSYSGFTTS